MRASRIVAAAALAVGFWSTAALADGTGDCHKTARGTITCDETKFVLHPPRPAVAVDVGRLVPRAPLPELRKSLVDRIAQAVESDPF
jgi:hypothetical protein